VNAVISCSGTSHHYIRKQFALLLHCIDTFEGLIMHGEMVDRSKDTTNDLLPRGFARS
jgi:hypothetical protein